MVSMERPDEQNDPLNFDVLLACLCEQAPVQPHRAVSTAAASSLNNVNLLIKLISICEYEACVTHTQTPPSSHVDKSHARTLSASISFKYNMITGWRQQHNQISRGSISATGTTTICLFNSVCLSVSHLHRSEINTLPHVHTTEAHGHYFALCIDFHS